MKRLLLSTLLLISVISIYAEEKDKQESAPKSTLLSVLLDKVTLTGYGQIGYTYDSYDFVDKKPSNTFDVKRIMFMAEAQVFRNMTLYFMYDFGNTKLHEIWGEYQFCEAFRVKAGQFKVPFTIENILSPSTLEIINGAQSVMYLAGISSLDECYGGKAGRDIGVMIQGDFLPYKSWNLLSYKLGVFNGQGINTKDLNNQKDVIGWLMVNPFKEISLGGSFYIGEGHALTDNPFGDFLTGSNYKRNRWSVGTEVKTSPVYIRAEYLQGKDGHIESNGGYITTSVHIHPRFDLIASYDYLNRNKDANQTYDVVTKQSNYIIGAQWNFYRRCRLQAQYVFQDRGEGHHNANLIMTQFQLGF